MWRSGRVAAVVAALAVGIIVAEADTVDVTTLSLEASPLGLNPTPPPTLDLEGSMTESGDIVSLINHYIDDALLAGSYARIIQTINSGEDNCFEACSLDLTSSISNPDDLLNYVGGNIPTPPRARQSDAAPAKPAAPARVETNEEPIAPAGRLTPATAAIPVIVSSRLQETRPANRLHRRRSRHRHHLTR